MKAGDRSVIARLLHGEGGQALVMVGFLLALLLAGAAVSIDMGNLYYSYQELLTTTQAAALAGGAAIVSQTTDAVSTAYQYTGDTTVGGIYNVHPNLNITSATAQMGCISTTAYPNYGLPPCDTYGVNTGNSIKVTESATVNTYFARLFGVPTIPISASAIAGATGGAGSTWNVAVVIDTTVSMGSNDSACGNISRLQCAMNGLQTLLTTLTPCPTTATCSATNAIDRVSLFTFPNVTPGSVNADYCGGTKGAGVTTQPYTFPSSSPTSAGYSPTGSTYQLLGYLDDYQQSPRPKTGAALSTSSNLAKASGDGCAGLQNPGGQGTYYAGVIYAAQASLLAEQVANPGSKNAMIILSDGDATAQQNQMGSTATNTGLYPSYNDECQQAVTAANSVASQNAPNSTRVYSVAYGVSSNQGSTCTTDRSSKSNPTGTGITACQTIQAIGGGAQSPYFYSDANSNASGCTALKNNGASDLNSIFLKIGESLTSSRLVPSNVAFTAD
jgi:Flp pilus assembly protein TadG